MSVPDAPHRRGHVLLAVAAVTERYLTEAKVVEPRAHPIGLRGGPVEPVRVQSRVRASIGLTIAAEDRVEARAATEGERRVGCLAGVIRLFADSTVVLRQASPFGIGRQPPVGSEQSTALQRRVPRI